MFGCLVDWLARWLVGWLVACLVGWLAGWFVGCFNHQVGDRKSFKLALKTIKLEAKIV